MVERINFDPLPAAYSAADFTPLAKLGQLFNQPDEATLASLSQRYGTSPPSGVGAGDAGGAAGGGGGDYSKAIAGIESGGRYDLVGPATASGDRAYGKYQVMGNNIPGWTQAALGRAMTPAEFLADTKAQEAVFNHRFGQYVSKYGPEGAAKAWFAGEGGMNNPNAKDLFGTTVSEYARRFNAGLEDQ
jgi:hypothetical protein